MNKMQVCRFLFFEDFDRPLDELHQLIWGYTAGSPTVVIENSFIKVITDNTLNSGIYIQSDYVITQDVVFETLFAKDNANRIGIIINIFYDANNIDLGGVYTHYSFYGNKVRRFNKVEGSWYYWSDGDITLNEPYLYRASTGKSGKVEVECFKWGGNKVCPKTVVRLTPVTKIPKCFRAVLRNTDVAVAGISVWADYIAVRYKREPEPQYRCRSQVYSHILNGKGKEVGVMSVGGVM